MEMRVHHDIGNGVSRGFGGRGCGIFRGHKNRTLAPSIYMIYISSRREPRVCATLSHAAACTHVRACMRASVIRDCRSSSDAPDGSGVSSPASPPPLPPPHPPPSPPPLPLPPSTSVPFSNGTGENGGICIHTTSHTVRFNISGHGWKLSPETQVDTRGTTGPDERRHTRDCRLFPLLLDVNGASASKCDHR